MASRIGLMLTVALVTLTAAAQGLAADWLLLSREGGCTALDVLSRKLPNLPLIQTPDQFEAYLYAAGLEYSHKLHANGRLRCSAAFCDGERIDPIGPGTTAW